MSSNLPDNVTQADIDRHFGEGLEQYFSADTHTAAAMVWLADACGMDWQDAWEWLYESLENDAPLGVDSCDWQDAASDELKKIYQGKVGACLSAISDYANDCIKSRADVKARLAVKP